MENPLEVPAEEPGRERFSLREAVAPGIAAVKHNWAPFLLMQVLAAVLVIAYYRSAGLREATEAVQRIKSTGGVPFDILTGSLACGLLPQLAKAVTGKVKDFSKPFWLEMLFNAFVYSIIAIEVDYFYQFQGSLFGIGIDWQTLVKKTTFDMAIFSPILSIPSAVVLFEWRKAGFSSKELIGSLTPRFYEQKIVPALIPCWAFWIPMLMCVYALPPNLQFPFAQLGEASWCILFIFIATAE